MIAIVYLNLPGPGVTYITEQYVEGYERVVRESEPEQMTGWPTTHSATFRVESLRTDGEVYQVGYRDLGCDAEGNVTRQRATA